jgi:hypothetical protein
VITSFVRACVVGLAASITLLAGSPSAALAQGKGRIRIDQIRVGFPIGLKDSQFKAGAWTPVYVDVTAGPERIPRGDYNTLTIEGVDTDDVRNNYTIPLPPLEPGEAATLIAYTKPGSSGDEIRVVIRIDDRIADSKGDIFGAIALDHHLYLTLGKRLGGLKRALSGEAANDQTEPVGSFGGPQAVTGLDDLREFPSRWFGYEGVDMIVLCTSNRDFLTAFLNEREGRKEALAEWVRRGGRILVTVGRNQDIVSQFEILQNMLPVTVKGTQSLPFLTGPASWTTPAHGPVENPVPKANPNAPRPAVEIATLVPKSGRDVDELLRDKNGQLLVARGAYGMGKVTVVALDLDMPPFTSWIDKGQNEFWKKLVTETAPPLQIVEHANQARFAQTQEDTSDLGTQLQVNIEHFADVPVISFGWVALFILIYILIVGPLDYFFLKKVVKRLELTWITFPTVVITISVVAYFTAYWLKGNDQRINKLDVIDIDLHTQQVYGTTWFSVFSPRIQNYFVGLQPAEIFTGKAPAGPPVTLSWLGRPETDWRGTGRPRSQGGLFRRAYDYAPDATAMLRVPIQVWSTKSFTGTWAAPMDATTPVLVADLKHPAGNRDSLSGTITSNYPAPLEDVVLYQSRDGVSGRWYSLDKLLPGVPRRVDNLFAGDPGQDMDSWMGGNMLTNRQQPSPNQRVQNFDSAQAIVKHLMFQQYDRAKMRNNLLRWMDQSWRLPHKDEVVLFARIAPADGDATTVAAAPAMPSLLWLGELPGPGAQKPPPILGTMKQESFVRIFIPVQSGN